MGISKSVRNLIIVFGDQLDADSAALDGCVKSKDLIWMAETREEASHVWCHKLRLFFFFSAMRHFAKELKKNNYQVSYHELTENHGINFEEILLQDIELLRPEKLIVVEPGDFRVMAQLEKVTKKSGIELEVREDSHFYATRQDFEEWASDRKTFVLETFYRWMRKRHDILLDGTGEPEGGEWNYDKENRDTFSSQGPKGVVPLPKYPHDSVSKSVAKMIEDEFPDNPGTLEFSQLPVTRDHAKEYLDDFIQNRLRLFGKYQDAMWTDEAFLFHSRLSCLLNVKLLSPQECVEAAIEAYRAKQAPLNSVEGFVRQIVGWREFCRGVYYKWGEEYLHRNELDQNEELPHFFWDGQTDMECVRQSMAQVIDHGYAHHIQRLMVLGLVALQYGANPRSFHDWHMAMYLDAIDWVSAPNTIGMSQYGDGGIVGTKPYCASGNYINKMGNYCKQCRYSHSKAHGDGACPVTTLYWDFLDRHFDRLEGNRRMAFQVSNIKKKRKKDSEIKAIRQRAQEVRDAWSKEKNPA